MIESARARVRLGGLRGAELLGWLAERAPEDRDAALEELLGIRGHPPQDPVGEERMGYMPAAIAPVVRAVLDAPIGPGDVFVDLGSGLGKIALAVHLLTGARALGIDLQADLVAQARARAADLALPGVEFRAEDALDADLGDASVVFLYLPFTGRVLAGVMGRLEAVARRRDLVVCALGLDLRGFGWLAERPSDEFWLSIYDSRIPGATPRAAARSPLAAAGEAIAAGRREKQGGKEGKETRE